MQLIAFQLDSQHWARRPDGFRDYRLILQLASAHILCEYEIAKLKRFNRPCVQSSSKLACPSRNKKSVGSGGAELAVLGAGGNEHPRMDSRL